MAVYCRRICRLAFGVSLMCLFVAGSRADEQMLNDENWKGRQKKEQADSKEDV